MATFLWCFFIRSTEPTHEGKTLTQWLAIATAAVGDQSDIAAADKAIGRIGSNAVPTLLEKLTAKDPFWLPVAEPWNWLVSKTAPIDWYPKLYINEFRASDNHEQALHGFAVIRTNGNSAVRRLSILLQDKQFGYDAAKALESIHTAQALDALMTGLTNADADIRYLSLRTAGSIGIDLGVPTLLPWAEQILALQKDSDERVADHAISLMTALLPEERAVPMLLNMLRDSNPTLQFRALRLLVSGPESAMEGIAQSLPHLAPTNRVRATNSLLWMNVYRAPSFGVNTNGVGEHFFRVQALRQAERLTNSISPAPTP